MKFKTKEITLKEIVKDKLEFLIPVYQRPYVWDAVEINKLLEDLEHNFKNNIVKNLDNDYFVGNTYVVKSPETNNLLEVIDGQQRFTTFWLISFCFKNLNINSDLTNYLEIEYDNNKKDIRFDFDIRKEVYEYLKGLLDGSSDRRFQDVSNFEFLKNIASGIETIKGYLKAKRNELNLLEYGNYIFNNVKFIFNEAPEYTDLNALFVALGTSGIQLQQSDILKARLLDKIIEKNERIKYAKIWEACENMNNYFESNVKTSFPYNNDKDKIKRSHFSEFNETIFNLKNDNYISEGKRNLTIDEILKIEDKMIFNNTTEIIQNSACRSIISFNILLSHTYRIFRKQNGFTEDIESMDSKKILENIKIEEIKEVEKFFLLLWRVRYLFDRYVVKWRNEEGEEISNENEKLLLASVNKNESKGKIYFSRSNNENSEIQMLQSVLYFTGIFAQQYWLTPFIDFLLKSENLNNENLILKELERIDNIMLPGDKKEISWKLINEEIALPKFEDINKTLSESSGTGFNHYWFYKLEYILWKNRDVNDDKVKQYRITSKNSIEHIFPQNEENKNNLNDLDDGIDWLNAFGNLALLSVGQNSSYSNQDVAKKRIDFYNKSTYDSLKLAKIYANNSWNSEQIKQHQEEMIILLENHYQQG
ncbi:DUF262 domain-containing protein [Flavobacterium procerum]|uniref:DUF262 domain-containing protein n=1 Tax=Flavobacterium procerum TaxID=1455569 RepID=A0ABV6BMY9_9FLAO